MVDFSGVQWEMRGALIVWFELPTDFEPDDWFFSIYKPCPKRLAYKPLLLTRASPLVLFVRLLLVIFCRDPLGTFPPVIRPPRSP